MNGNVLNSIDDIDAMLDKKYGITDAEDIVDESDEIVADEQVEDVIIPDESLDIKTDDNVDEEQIETEKEVKPEKNDEKVDTKITKEDKKDYTFNVMRKENSSLKQVNQELEPYRELIKELAQSEGYTDIDRYISDVKVARINREAKDKGLDPVLYRENMENKARIAELERQREQDLYIKKAQTFKDEVDKASTKYGVDAMEIYERLDDAGYDANSILLVPNPSTVINGVLIDKIKISLEQEQIDNKKRLDELSESKNGKDYSNTKKTVSMAGLIADDIANYKANNFL